MSERDDTAGPADRSSDDDMSHNPDDASARLFDLRYLIGGLFTLYGVLLMVSSPFVDDTKADGIDMNLWLGIGMAALGVFFLGWARLRPLVVGSESIVPHGGRS